MANPDSPRISKKVTLIFGLLIIIAFFHALVLTQLTGKQPRHYPGTRDSRSAQQPQAADHVVRVQMRSGYLELPSKLAWPSICQSMAWKNDNVVVGYFHFAGPALIEWDAKTWQPLAYRPLTTISSSTDAFTTSLSSDGRYLAVNADRKRLQVLDTSTAKPIELALGSDTGSWGHFGQHPTLMSELNGKSLRVWDIKTRRILREFKCTGRHFTSAHVSPDGKLLLSTDDEGTAILWSIQNGRMIRKLSTSYGVQGVVAFSRDNKYLVTTGDDRNRFTPDEIMLWNLKSGKVIWHKPDPSGIDDSVRAILFFENNQKLLVCCPTEVHVWSLQKGKQVGLIKLSDILAGMMGPQRVPFALSPDGKVLAAGPERFSIPGYKLMSRTTPYFLPTKNIVVSPDGRTLSAIQFVGDVGIWDLDKFVFKQWEDYIYDEGSNGAINRGDIERVREIRNSAEARFNNGVLMAISADRKLAAMLVENQIRIYNTKSWQQQAALESIGVVKYMVFDPRGNWIAGTTGLGVTLWNISTGKIIRTLVAAPPDLRTHKGDFWMVLEPRNQESSSTQNQSLR